MDTEAVIRSFNEASMQAGRMSEVLHKFADIGVRDAAHRGDLLREYRQAETAFRAALALIPASETLPGLATESDAPSPLGEGQLLPPPVVPPDPIKVSDPVEVPVPREEAVLVPPVVPINTPKNKVFNGLKLFVNSEGSAAEAAAKAMDPYDKKVFRFFAGQPVAYWYGGWNGALEGLRRAAEAARKEGQVLVVVAYNIPSRDASGVYSAGGTSYDRYPGWLRSGLDAVGEVPCVWIVEPDALPDLSALPPDYQQKRLDLISNAVDAINSYPNSWAYIDAGNYTWQKEEVMFERLSKAGIDKAEGFALNVSGFGWLDQTLGYGNKLSALLGSKHFVVDTSRNGAGPWTNPSGPQWDDWCNPPGRLLGETPRLTPSDVCDAYLWIKPAGQSDGDCKGGPRAGEWYPSYAIDLARNKVLR